ncbi:MAG: beta-lactamase family protein [Gemmatimonadales bacterium]|nr:beta-lactamase family protein [Gemmatimonadales bacterium]
MRRFDQPSPMRLRASFLLLGAILTCRAAAAQQPAPDLTTRLENAFRDSVAAAGIIGAQLAVWIPGRGLWSTEFGTDEPGRPMTATAMLGTGSISKMLAAVAVLRLVDQGKLTLDDTVGRWLAEFPTVPPHLQVRALLWHQSGLPEYGGFPGFADSVRANPERSWTSPELIRFIGPPDFEPGTSWRASNTDRLLLGEIVARVTGRPLGEYMRREFFTRGDGSSWTPGQQKRPRARVATHWTVDTTGRRVNLSELIFNASLFTARIETYISARDLALFAQRLFAGDLLSRRGKETLFTIVPDDQRIPGQTGGGVGIRRFEYFGRLQYGNSGATPNSSALYLYDPETKVIVALSTNQSGASHRNSHFRIVPLLMQIANEAVSPRR